MTLEEFFYDSLGPFIGKAGKMLEKRMNENFSQAGYDITLEHWIVLAHLWLEDGRNQKTLCDFVGKHKTRMKRSIDSLETQNFVVRIPDQQDKRNKLIYLTHKGKSIREELMVVYKKTLLQATEGIAPEDIKVCIHVLDQVFMNLVDEAFLQHFSKNSFNRNKSIAPSKEKS